MIELATNGTYDLVVVDNTSANGPNGLPVITNDGGQFALTIHGNGSIIQRNPAAASFRIFEIGAGNVTMDNLKIQHGSLAYVPGSTTRGAGILAPGQANTTLALVNCTFYDDIGLNGGGGIENPGTRTVVAIKCVFDSCLPSGRGGGIDNRNGGTAMVRGCTFVNCANAIYNRIGMLTLTSSSFEACANDDRGGAIINAFGATVNARDCTFSNNEVSLYDSYYQIQYSAFGGAIWNSATANLTNCTFYANKAGWQDLGDGSFGGAIYNLGGSLTVSNCTFLGNRANGFGSNTGGAAIYSDGGTVSTVNTIYAGQFSPELLLENSAVFTSQGNNLSDDTAGGDGTTGPGGLLNIPGDIRNTDPMLNPTGLQDNGGLTKTVALQVNSPAIDYGNNAWAPNRDQRGYLRHNRSDIGAYEYNANLFRLSSITTGNADVVIACEVVSGKTYELQRKANITDSWPNSGILQLTATENDSENFTDSGALSLGKAFYRVVIVP